MARSNPLKERALLIDALSTAVSSGEFAIGEAPLILRRVLEEEAWREFETRLGKTVTPVSFEEFVTTPPLEGLGASIALVRRLVADDPYDLDLLDQALQNPAHLHRDVANSNVRPTGTTKDQALRRLRKDRPDLHAEVLAGELSPHAAMVQAGFRRRTISVPVDDVERTAHTLLRHLDSDAVAVLIKTLEANV